MRWLLGGCLIGGLGAMLRYWQWPYAQWVSLTGFVILVIGFLSWLGSHSGQRNRGDSSGSDGGSSTSSGDGWCNSGSGGDCGGGDGGGGD